MTTSSLSAARQRLVALMTRIHYGSIANLVVAGGEPVFDPPPAVTREVKCGDAPPPPSRGDFQLKRQVVDLFAQLDAVGSGTVPLIEVKGGLPFRVFFAEAEV